VAYFYVGSEFSSPSGIPLSAKLSADLFAPVFNRPSPPLYQGWFVNVSGSRGLIAPIGFPPSAASWSPTPTYQINDTTGAINPPDCTGCSDRFGHVFKVGPLGVGDLSVSVSLTCYFELWEFDSPDFTNS
jgi:hypothetical protein